MTKVTYCILHGDELPNCRGCQLTEKLGMNYKSNLEFERNCLEKLFSRLSSKKCSKHYDYYKKQLEVLCLV